LHPCRGIAVFGQVGQSIVVAAQLVAGLACGIEKCRQFGEALRRQGKP
jgi:hypothetical protein